MLVLLYPVIAFGYYLKLSNDVAKLSAVLYQKYVNDTGLINEHPDHKKSIIANNVFNSTPTNILIALAWPITIPSLEIIPLFQ
jgi:hypothetical protein